MEYQRLKKLKARFEWFTFYGGPKSIQALAENLKHGAQYELMYRQWSGITHAEDVSHFLTRGKTGKAAICPLRNQDEFVEIVVNSSGLMLSATKLMLTKFRPGESKYFAKWYLTEIRDSFLSFQKGKNPPPKSQ